MGRRGEKWGEEGRSREKRGEVGRRGENEDEGQELDTERRELGKKRVESKKKKDRGI